MRFWQIKHAEDATQAEQVLTIEGRDSYERTDNYNVYGLFCFFALRLRSAFFDWSGTPTQSSDSIALKQPKFNSPMTHTYSYELYMPLITINMRSKSKTIRSLAFELSHIFSYLLQSDVNARQFENLCVFQTDEEVPR